MNKKAKIGILILSSLIVLCLFPALFEPVQRFTVSMVEKLKNDDINDPFWMKQMFAFAFLGMTVIVIADIILLTQKGQSFFRNFVENIKSVYARAKTNKKYLFILLGLYFFGYFSIIRANFWNIAIDDLARQISGTREWVNFYRYFAEIGSIFIHTSMNVFDVAPLTQFIALFLAALASFFVIDIFSDGNFSVKKCIASLPIGLFPFYLSNFSYRYDSPYMALSLCISIVPFLFRKDLKSFIAASVISQFIMCTSYQASSGIYIFMSILIFAKMFLFENHEPKKLAIFTILSIASYAFTLLFFSFLFMEQPEGGTYVDESISMAKLLPNTVTYLKTITTGLGKSAVLVFSFLILVLFIIISTIKSQKGKLISLLITILAILVSIPLTYGSYLALGRPEFIPRTFIGIGVFIGCVSVFTLSIINEKGIAKILSSLVAFCLSYSVVAFAFAFGNAEYAQKEYIKFRGTMLAMDLSECITPANENIELLFINDIGFPPDVDVLIKTYPFTAAAIDKGFIPDRNSQYILESMNLISLVEKSNHNFRNADFPIVKDTAYHKIQANENKYLITFKNPRYKTIKTRRFIEEGL